MTEKKGYIPKDKRKKILLLSDDIRVTSGVGTMSREIVGMVCGKSMMVLGVHICE